MAESDILQGYYDQLEEIGNPQPIRQQDFQSRLGELSMLASAPRRSTIYDMATNLSQGLTAQAQSGRPSSIGYGLAQGFNLFSEAAAQKAEAAEAVKQSMKMAAFESLQRDQENQRAMQRAIADAQLGVGMQELQQSDALELQTLKDAATGTSGFSGKSLDAQVMKILAEGERNPLYKTTPEYKLALAEYMRPKIVTGPTGSFEQTRPPIDAIFGDGSAPPPTARAIDPTQGAAAVTAPQEDSKVPDNAVYVGRKILNGVSVQVYRVTMPDGSTEIRVYQ
jgi:hypothetical protein